MIRRQNNSRVLIYIYTATKHAVYLLLCLLRSYQTDFRFSS